MLPAHFHDVADNKSRLIKPKFGKNTVEPH